MAASLFLIRISLPVRINCCDYGDSMSVPKSTNFVNMTVPLVTCRGVE
ncbi:Uncharacterised protein [Yersinia pseudotuberculosis]|nr:hypothetical protein BZ19_1172 [Yersinia pseudotuberculosis str. PA3606]UFA61930.1 Uncharacterized protein YP598_2312 [Yersinia pseudotuberculosis]CNH87455.1 Uncharacterised protein [Yersinia pseudotuberculosis]CNI02564.1 Uncharacterised protein [Yersinia pseudotuberculosis]